MDVLCRKPIFSRCHQIKNQSHIKKLSLVRKVKIAHRYQLTLTKIWWF